MLIKRTAMWLLAWGTLLLLAGRATAQPANSNLDYQTPQGNYENDSAPYSNASPPTHRPVWPFKPLGFEPSFQWFGPAETSGYGNGPRPHIGFFGSYERLFWSFSKPSTELIGSPTATGPVTYNTQIIPIFPTPLPAVHSADTGFLLANGAWGNRIEMGYIDTDNRGWLVSVLDHVQQGQYHIVQNAHVEFNDPNGFLTGFTGLAGFVLPVGKMPTIFDIITMKNITTMNGVEIMRMYRPGRRHSGGFFDLLYGARWLQLSDTFVVSGTNNAANGVVQNLINPLSDSNWNTRVQNNLIGPEIGGRWSFQNGHWITSAEARFLAAANLQDVHQITNLGTNAALNNSSQVPPVFAPLQFPGIGTNTHSFITTFAPVGEIRVQTVYAVTSNVGLKFGYTGMVMTGVSRASNRIDYSVPNLIGISPSGVHQNFFLNGINFGVEVNR